MLRCRMAVDTVLQISYFQAPKTRHFVHLVFDALHDAAACDINGAAATAERLGHVRDTATADGCFVEHGPSFCASQFSTALATDRNTC